MQDDEADKMREIHMMGDIFRLSSLTIAAASASDPGKGFLHKSSKFKPGPEATIPLYLPDGRREMISLTPFVSDVQSNEPLHTRGWALQESLMSSRLLVYEEREVLWHCETEIYKRVAPTYFDYADPITTSLENGDNCTVRALPLSTSSLEGPSFHSEYNKSQFWAKIVTDYSNRKMKHESDRLLALSGVIQIVSRAWNGEYLAGLWRSCLIYQLCWFCPSTSTPNERRSSWSETRLKRRPSWSWISVPFPCQVIFLAISTVDATVLDCTVEPLRPEAPYGEIIAGQLTLRGKIIHDDRSLGECRMYYDHRTPGEIVHIGHIYWLLIGLNMLSSLIGEPPFLSRKDYTMFVGLILHKTGLESPRRTNTYKRIGCFECWEDKTKFQKAPLVTVCIEWYIATTLKQHRSVDLKVRNDYLLPLPLFC